MVPYQSSLISALANEVGPMMRDIDPLQVLRAARNVQRTFRGYRGRQQAKSARAAATGKKRKTSSTSRFAPNRTATTPSYSVGADTGLGLACRMGLLQNEQMIVPEFSAENISGRDSLVAFVKGYRICRDFHTTITAGGTGDCGPVEVHWALIQWKCPISDASVQTLLPQNFFRTSEFIDRKAVKFGEGASDVDAYPVAGDPWTNKLNCLSMNPDNGYSIITHQKRTIHPRRSGQDVLPDGSSSSEWKIDYYQPINKFMETESRDIDRWKAPIYEVFWCNTINATQHPNSTTNGAFATFVRSNKYHTCYFENKR